MCIVLHTWFVIPCLSRAHRIFVYFVSQKITAPLFVVPFRWRQRAYTLLCPLLAATDDKCKCEFELQPVSQAAESITGVWGGASSDIRGHEAEQTNMFACLMEAVNLHYKFGKLSNMEFYSDLFAKRQIRVSIYPLGIWGSLRGNQWRTRFTFRSLESQPRLPFVIIW